MVDRDRIFSRNVEFLLCTGAVTESNRLKYERHVSESRLSAAIDGESFRAFELTIDEWCVQLQSEAIVEGIAGNELRDRTVLVLPGWIRRFASIDLHRS